MNNGASSLPHPHQWNSTTHIPVGHGTHPGKPSETELNVSIFYLFIFNSLFLTKFLDSPQGSILFVMKLTFRIYVTQHKSLGIT